MMISGDIIERAIRKAQCNRCRYHVAAICYDERGRMLGIITNRPRFSKEGGSLHAEIHALIRFYPRLKEVVILRCSNKTGVLLPIHPCKTCKKTLEECGISIYTVTTVYKVEKC
jgi:cytidine deaminase